MQYEDFPGDQDTVGCFDDLAELALVGGMLKRKPGSLEFCSTL